MGVPACLWRRTGEIYKGNREFSELVGVDGYMLRDVRLSWTLDAWILSIFQGRLCIYELMAEESAVNYWEVQWINLCMSRNTKLKQAISCFQKYGHVAFDSSQKAVLTSCVLRYKPLLNSGSSNRKFIPTEKPPLTLGFDSGSPAKNEEEQQPMEESFISCCFSFTIRRDKWGIPSMIVGNFIQC